MYKEQKIKKIFYSIGDVAEMLKLKVSKIRFWEKEFNIIKPNRDSFGKRKFTEKDISKIKLINELLTERKYTIKGAKRIIKLKKEKIESEQEIIEKLNKIKSFLKEIQKNI